MHTFTSQFEGPTHNVGTIVGSMARTATAVLMLQLECWIGSQPGFSECNVRLQAAYAEFPGDKGHQLPLRPLLLYKYSQQQHEMGGTTKQATAAGY